MKHIPIKTRREEIENWFITVGIIAVNLILLILVGLAK